MKNQFSFKDFEKVHLKATYNMKIGNRNIEAGETITVFDKIQIASMREDTNIVTAHGGFDDRAHVFWITTTDEQLVFSQGVFSDVQFALLLNSRMIELDNKPICITEDEQLESDENGVITLSNTPVGQCWIYNKNTGEKITNFTINDNVINISEAYLDVVVTYNYNYNGGAKNYLIGQRLYDGFVELEGRTRVKDDTTGQVVTGIFKIPKLKLMSNLSITVGKSAASPVVGQFTALAMPVGSRGNTHVSEFYILNDDIESDL